MHVLQADPALGPRASLLLPPTLGPMALVGGRSVGDSARGALVYCDTASPALPDLFDAGAAPVASPRLLARLQALGVDNLEELACPIEDVHGEPVGDGYRVLNVIGRVACVDVARSDATWVEGRLARLGTIRLAPGVPRHLLMFRPREWNLCVLVHDSVARALLADAMPGVVLTPVDAWVNEDF